MTGTFGPRHYRQYFGSDGKTTYVEQGRRPTFGTWSVTDEGRFCSVWGQTESCYDVVLDGASIIGLYPSTEESRQAFNAWRKKNSR